MQQRTGSALVDAVKPGGTWHARQMPPFRSASTWEQTASPWLDISGAWAMMNPVCAPDPAVLTAALRCLPATLPPCNSGEGLSYDEWVEEVGGQRTWLAGCGVPEE